MLRWCMTETEPTAISNALFLTHLCCVLEYETLVILEIMDRIRDGYFDVVLLMPPAATWSKARHSQDGTQPPWRTSKHRLHAKS